MNVGSIPQPSRYTAMVFCVVFALLAVLGAQHWHWMWLLAVLFGALTLLGIHDLLQTHHSIQRNYPVIGHIRWRAEMVRPEIRQYLIESNEDAAPFSRDQRSLVYQRAKGEPGEDPFGTQLDVSREGDEL